MTSPNLCDARTFLFVPADRPKRFDKAAESGSDIVVLDLEDAVGATDKVVARGNMMEYLRAGHHAVVRINDASTAHFGDDLKALVEFAQCPLMLAKADASSVAELTARFPGRTVIALIETARGLVDATVTAATPGVARLALGAIDLAAELGVDPDRSPLIDRARSDLAYASAAANLPGPIDGVTLLVDDTAAIAHDVERAGSYGFTAKLCIHPRQIAPAHNALASSAAEVAWARGILAAADSPDNGAVFVFDGAMVDKPVIDRARSIVARAADRIRGQS